MSQAWRASTLTPDLWESYFYTKFTTVRTAFMTPFLCIFIFTVLRLAGARTLTQATLFNKIVMVAVGTLVGSVALRPNTPMTAVVIGTLIIVGIALLIDVAYSSGWIPAYFVHPRSVLLYANGQVLDSKLSKCLLAREKLHSELRSKGHASLDEVFAVVLEHTGAFSVITKDAAQKSDLSLLQDVEGYDKYIKHLVPGNNSNGATPAAAPSGPAAHHVTVNSH